MHKFAALVDSGSFTKAAGKLHLSQPALTAAVQKLERELKTELLIRGGRTLQLTEAGKVAYEAAHDLATRTANLRQQLGELNQQQITLRIGMIDSLADTLICHEEIFRELRGQAHVALTIDNSARLLTNLEHNDIDIAFIAKQSGRLPQSIDGHLFLGDEPLLVVLHPSLLAATLTAMTEGRLPQFLSYNQLATTRQLVHAALTAQNLEPEPTFYSTSPDILLKLALTGQGIAALPHRMVAQHLAQKELLPLPNMPVILRPIIAAHRHSRQLSAPLNALCQQLCRILHNLEAQANAE